MKNAVITGASKGIGKATAFKLAEAGYRVIINYNKSEVEANEIVSQLASKGLKGVAYKCDVSNYDEFREMLYYTYGTFGSLDVLVNNAGISIIKDICSTSLDDWKLLLDVNLSSVFYGCKIASEIMIDQCFGKIINISSIWGNCGGAMETAYSATKGGIISLTKALAKELALMHINVNCICPGAIETSINKLSPADKKVLIEEIPLSHMGTPNDIAETVLFLSNSSGNYITGQVLSINGGLDI